MVAFGKFFSEKDVSDSGVAMDVLLPLVHTTPFDSAENILEKAKLEKRCCSEFKENLLYFFYARPAYRSKDDEVVSSESLLPVVFIVKPTEVDIKRAYPFDTGAYSRYVPTHLPESGNRIDYELPNDLMSVQQYVKAVCGNNWSYYHGEFKDTDELPDSIISLRKENINLHKLLEFLSAKDKRPLDDRSHTVEFMTAIDLEFSGKLLAVVAPDIYRNHSNLTKVLRDNDAAFYPYSYYRSHGVKEYVGSVFEATKKYYIDYGYLEEVS